MELQTITIREYLTRKNIEFRESGKELITRCLFNGCDKDSKNGEAHLYLDIETGQYECKKCGEKGNIVILAKHLGDGIQEIAVNQLMPTKSSQKTTKFDAELVETCHLALPTNIRQYLNARGISNAIVDAHKLGWGKFYGKWWITIPIPDNYGIFRFFKLRQDPNVGDDKITYPKGVEAQIYGWEMITALLRYKVTEQYSIDSGSFGPTEVRILISFMLILEVIVKDSILYTSSFACLVLLIMNFLETGKILKFADERDKKEKEGKISK